VSDIWFVIALVVFLAIYFLPWIVAYRRNHPSGGGIIALNLLLGWTFIGWVISLVWALSGPRGAPDYEGLAAPTRSCPYCAEPILAAARKCKHCGSEVQPLM
jgi:hypothetical protein